MKSDRGWNQPFEDPVSLPNGRQLVTLKDTANYIMKLSKVGQKLPEWQTATAALILVAERNGHTIQERIGVLKALNRGKQDRREPRN